MSKDVNKSKESIVLRALSNLFKKGTVTNATATDFAACVGQNDSNAKIIAEIAEKLKQLSALDTADSILLKELFAKHNLFEETNPSTRFSFAEDSTDTDVQHHHETVQLTDELKITDMTAFAQDVDDEYRFILGIPCPKRQYLLQYEETHKDITVKYYNFIFGNFVLDSEDDEEKLITAFSRDNVLEALINSFGFMSLNENEPYSAELQASIFNRLYETQPSVRLNRIDGSKVSVLKIGNMVISEPNKLVENAEQYIIYSTNVKTFRAQLYLCYGKINFELISTSPQYEYNIANILLSNENLNCSRYIGSMIGNSIIKSEIPFGEPLTTNRNISPLYKAI